MKPDQLKLKFEIHRVPFFLEPDIPQDENITETHMERMYRKFGKGRGMSWQSFLDNWAELKAPHALEERGQEVGIAAFNEERVVSSTMPSHRLVRWAAREKGLAASEALYDVLNRKHFIEGSKLNDKELLAAAVAEAGHELDPEKAREFLATSLGEDEIRQIVSKVHSLGIHSIPTFVMDAEMIISGAAHSRELLKAMRKIEQKHLLQLEQNQVQSAQEAEATETIFASAVDSAL